MNLSRASNSREKSAHARSTSDLKTEGKVTSKDLENHIFNRLIESSNPYVHRKEKGDATPGELNFTRVRQDGGSHVVDPKFSLDDKLSTDKYRVSRAQRLSFQHEPFEKSEKLHNEYLKSLLDDEMQAYEENFMRQNQTLPIADFGKNGSSDNSGCLDETTGNEYKSMHQQYDEMMQSSTNILRKKKSPKKKIPMVSPVKRTNPNHSIMQLTKSSK
jgi:hypothetical protein